MTNQEFSDEFDVLYNNIMSNQAPGLDEYEKSVFLTKAQDEIIKSYFDAPYNKAQEGFDGSRKRQYDFSNLIRVSTLFNINSITERIEDTEKLDRRSIPFLFPQDYFLSVNEILFDADMQYSILPLSYEEYQRVMTKPYAYPSKRAAWRLFTDKKNCNAYQEYIPNTEADYNFLSTWADQKRTLELTISLVNWSPETEETSVVEVSDTTITFTSEELECSCKLEIDCSWSSSKNVYNIDIKVATNGNEDDDDTIFRLIKEGLTRLKYEAKMGEGRWETEKACRHLDAFLQSSAPSKFTKIKEAGERGKVFKTNIVELPIAEVIGRFRGPVNYQLRYIRKPRPIILTALIGVSIGGQTEESSCQLPSELHHEILQRAVELAKAAYQGDFSSQIVLGQASATEKGIVQQGR